ncbi:MAG: hypothetical protein R2844_05415 [Caldilineales bacterium]
MRTSSGAAIRPIRNLRISAIWCCSTLNRPRRRRKPQRRREHQQEHRLARRRRPRCTIDTGSAQPIGCGDLAVGTTVGSGANVDWYACAPGWPETGPENVYLLSAPGGVTVDALLAGLPEDLDPFVLTDASPSSCIAAGDNSLSLPELAAGDYYLVVDGYMGAAGSYRLNVWCPLDPTPQTSPTPTPTATPRPGLLHLYLPLISSRLRVASWRARWRSDLPGALRSLCPNGIMRPALALAVHSYHERNHSATEDRQSSSGGREPVASVAALVADQDCRSWLNSLLNNRAVRHESRTAHREP